jgi:hypothetical protein
MTRDGNKTDRTTPIQNTNHGNSIAGHALNEKMDGKKKKPDTGVIQYADGRCGFSGAKKL